MKFTLSILAALLAVATAAPNPAPDATTTVSVTATSIDTSPATYTATKKYFTLVDQAPWMVERTSVVTWVATPSSTGTVV
ncbi:hypothetical protein PUNSTDRAFT_110749 [Punctularia strigosozonata HHB-11173 SS5]|uniref:uncharacterized protein n=1 Tax=Punctularia strigosozonata (strain HHB-11173) TaxID=741275 RepID=UPI0004417731|nr:uncharacterized protein PUNSTDRAFT_110749 [Punctularia strigosozonata HHB-11173 SS5]EIN14728.1 hypothetical protein PUNSTDRAFT_110749 [Punctularia strigosozonata HHB-11173 SS5]